MATKPADHSRLFCVLTVHGTFDGDFESTGTVRKSEDARRKEHLDRKIADGFSADDPTLWRDYAPANWWSDDGASSADCREGTFDEAVMKERQFFWFKDGKKVRFYKRIQSVSAHSVFDQLSIRQWGSGEKADAFLAYMSDRFAKYEGALRGPFFDRFIGIPAFDPPTCLARALSMISVAKNNSLPSTELLLRSIRWPERGRPSLNPLEAVRKRAGENSEYARRFAEEQLCEEIRFLESKNIKYIIVGHSHGGSIAYHALSRFSIEKIPYCQGMITFGAPIIQTKPRLEFQRPWSIFPEVWGFAALFAAMCFGAAPELSIAPTLVSLAPIALLFTFAIVVTFILYRQIALNARAENARRFKDTGKVSLHIVHRDDEVVQAFRNLFNRQGAHRLGKIAGSKTKDGGFALRVIDTFWRFSLLVAAFWILSGLNGLFYLLSGQNLGAQASSLANFAPAASAFCTPGVPGCGLLERFWAVLLLAGLSAVSIVLFVIFEVVCGRWFARRAVESGVGRIIAVFVAGMRKNQLNVDRIGPRTDYELIEPLSGVTTRPRAEKWHDVAAAITAVRARGLPGFGELLAELPWRLAEASHGRFAASDAHDGWDKYQIDLLSSPGIIHNAYTYSQTFMLFLAKKIAATVGLNPDVAFFDYADIRAFDADFTASSFDRDNMLNSDPSPDIDKLPIGKGRWRSWGAEGLRSK